MPDGWRPGLYSDVNKTQGDKWVRRQHSLELGLLVTVSNDQAALPRSQRPGGDKTTLARVMRQPGTVCIALTLNGALIGARSESYEKQHANSVQAAMVRATRSGTRAVASANACSLASAPLLSRSARTNCTSVIPRKPKKAAR